MDFLDVFDVFFLFSSDEEGGKKRNGPNGIFTNIKILLLLATIAWCVYEILQVVELIKPILFVIVFSAIGFLLTCVVMVVVWKLDWIEYITPRHFLSYLIPVVLISVSSASFMNRYYASERIFQLDVSTNSDQDSFILNSTVDAEFHLVISKRDYPDLKPGDSIQLKYWNGLLGFDRMQVVVPDFKKGDN